MKNDPRHVGIFIRLSTDDQMRGDSPATHEVRARTYAEMKGWNVLEVYKLDGVSGKTVKDDPEVKRMLSDVRRGHIKALIFSKLERFARNTRELLEFAEIFKEHGADLVSLTESIDTSTPAGYLLFTVMGALAQCDRETIAARVAAAVPIRAKLGKSLGGAAPYGFRWVDKKMEIDPSEAPIRKAMYDLFLEHRRVKTVAEAMNERGYRTRDGSLWSDTSVSRLLTDTSAKGMRLANHTKSLGKRKGWVSKSEKDWVYVPVPAIVDESIWNACNEILKGRRSRGVRQTKRVTHLFAGLTFCHCGAKMYVPDQSVKYTCTSCRNKIPCIDLDAIFAEELTRFVFSDAEIENYTRRGTTRLREDDLAIVTLEQEKKLIGEESDKLYALYIQGGLDVEGFKARNDRLLLRLKANEEELPRLKGRRDGLATALENDRYVLGARDLASRWPHLSHDEKRRIVETIVASITVGIDEVDIKLLYAPPPPPSAPPSLTPGRDSIRATQPHGCVALLPSLDISLIRRRFKAPESIGEHVKARRLSLSLRQVEVAELLGVCEETIVHWERNQTTTIPPECLPRVIAFLGYNPIPLGESLAAHLKHWRMSRGLSQKKAARVIGVDPGTLSGWERGVPIKQARHHERVGKVLSALGAGEIHASQSVDSVEIARAK